MKLVFKDGKRKMLPLKNAIKAHAKLGVNVVTEKKKVAFMVYMNKELMSRYNALGPSAFLKQHFHTFGETLVVHDTVAVMDSRTKCTYPCCITIS